MDDAIAIQQIDAEIAERGTCRSVAQGENVEIPLVNQLRRKTSEQRERERERI